ncbi:MAG TPA: acyltransferase family protein [Acidimicrobiales bacterium]|nr:acyltransferase family protein [Acidimicrobiales bacterium]
MPDRQPARPALDRQPSLDGLRAVAVTGVVLFHAGIGWLRGGFLGVEAFFVLSGYLITSLLVAECDASGDVRLGAFWLRRARRLLPALVLLIVTVALYQALAGAQHGSPDLVGNGLAALFYVANWHQIWTGSGYFTATGPTSPLQHTWSLGIEEQFYLVWPVVVLGVVHLTRRAADPVRRRRRLLLAVASAGALASAGAMAILSRGGGIDRAYYGTDTRASGILVGAALALLLTRRPLAPEPRGRRAATAAGLVGAAAVLAAMVLVPGDAHWLYEGGFLVFDLAMAAVILAVHVGRRSVLARGLSTRPLVALGLVSYGVYLWHFPLFLWLTESSAGVGGTALLALRLAATLVAATLSYVLVEKPIRTRRVPAPVLGALAPAAAAAAVAGLLLAPSLPAGAGVPATAAAVRASSQRVAEPGGAEGSSGAQGSSTAHDHAVTTLLVGDSLGLTLGMGLGVDAASYGVDLVNHTILGCGFTNTGEILYHTGFAPGYAPCTDAFDTWGQQADALHPGAIVVVLGFWDCFTHEMGGQQVHVGQPAFDAYLSSRIDALIARLGGGTVPIVLVGVPTTDSVPFPDGSPAPENDPARHAAMNALLRTAAATHRGVTYFDLDRVVSPGGVYTPTVHGQTCRWADGEHFTVFCGQLTQRTLLPLVDHLAAGAPATAR